MTKIARWKLVISMKPWKRHEKRSHAGDSFYFLINKLDCLVW